MSKIPFFKTGLLSVVAGFLTTSASAQLTVNLTAGAQGWYASDGIEGSSNQPSSTAFNVGAFEGFTYNNFFVFDRSFDPLLQFAQIRKATLELYLPEDLLDLGASYVSSDANDTGAVFSLYKFSGDRAALKAGTGGLTAFDDLGADPGGTFGARAVSAADNLPGALISVDLSAYFLTYINGLSGEFVLGGALSNPNDNPLPEDFEYMFGFSQNSPMANLRLEFVAVPEPGAYGLIGVGALGVLAWRRRAVRAVYNKG
jgi:hypothetical protein